MDIIFLESESHVIRSEVNDISFLILVLTPYEIFSPGIIIHLIWTSNMALFFIYPKYIFYIKSTCVSYLVTQLVCNIFAKLPHF